MTPGLLAIFYPQTADQGVKIAQLLPFGGFDRIFLAQLSCGNVRVRCDTVMTPGRGDGKNARIWQNQQALAGNVVSLLQAETAFDIFLRTAQYTHFHLECTFVGLAAFSLRCQNMCRQCGYEVYG